MIRAAILSLTLAQPVAAWEFTPGQPCLLTHSFHSDAVKEDIEVKLTYDPTAPLYTISIRRSGGFSAGSVFAMTFMGPNPIRIQTDRQELSADRKTLTVMDTGFGNVLNGLQFNLIALAEFGEPPLGAIDQLLEIPLTGAAEPVAAFRACDAPATS